MAYQTRRDPLLDETTQAALERRGRELLGAALVLVGCATLAIVLSYSPNDPNWLVSSDLPPQNWLGLFGASLAAPLFMILGWGALAIALIAIVWGARFLLHQVQERAFGRLVFAPIAIAMVSIYASTLEPGSLWSQSHSFGLGGLFGDTVMGVILSVLPIGSAFGIKLISVLLAGAMVALLGFAAGFNWADAKAGARYLAYSVIMTYSGILALLGRGAAGLQGAAGQLAAHQSARRAKIRRAEEEAAALDRAFSHGPSPMPSAPPLMAQSRMEAHEGSEPYDQNGFLSKMPGLIRRAEPLPEPAISDLDLPEPELVEAEALVDVEDMPVDAGMPVEDRVKAKISSVIKNRVRRFEHVKVAAAAPLTKGRGRGPTPLILDTTKPAPAPAAVPLPPEPPLTQAMPATLPPEPPLMSAPTQEAPQTRAQAPLGVSPEEAPSDAQTLDLEAPAPQVPAHPPIPVAEPRRVVLNPLRKPPAPSRQAQAEAQPALAFEEPQVTFEKPPLSLLTNPTTIQRHHLSDEALQENARMLENVLDDYGIKGEIVSVRPGPVVTMYELEPAPGLKASRVIGLADDIARSMAALSARVSTVPGRSVIGIELPNEKREMCVLREILAARDFGDTQMRLPLALGKDIGGDPVVANLAKMPHLLIAGTTGSGKSVAINTMILSLLYKLTPDECRLIMIDPKMLELSVYDGIPHLLSPVVTDPKKAVVALKWVVGEMEERYRKMSKMGVRNIEGYNGRVRDALAKDEMFSRTVQTGFDDETGEPVFETEEIKPEILPFIVVIVDEMADLMMVAGKEIEACIQRLAQMARASGIHLVMATQRPSVDVITGTIKANFPTRISFQVTSKIDSRTILGEMGAEQLLGMGDMLYMAGGSKITRCHGPFVSDEEVEEVVNHLKAFGPPSYVNTVLEGPSEDRESDIDAVLGLGGNTDSEDALYDQAVAVVLKDRKCSTSYIQRKLAIGYNKAARLVEQMEEQGLVSASNHVGKREILVPEQE